MKSIYSRFAIILFSILLASCGTNVEVTVVDPDTETETAAPEITVDPKYETDLPVRSFEGASFVMAVNDNPNIHHSIVPEEETGESLNDALIRRNVVIEETYGVDLQEYLYDYRSPGTLKSSVIAGDESWAIVMLTCPDALSWWKEDLLIPFDELPNLDLKKGYWDANINDSLSIGGVQYIAEGAFNLDIYDLTFCLLFNKSLTQQFALPSLYDTVLDGKWTMDTMAVMMETASFDSNGDGTMDEADNWGYTAHPKMVAPGFWIGNGVTSISKDAEDTPYISMMEEQFVTVFENIMALAHDSNTVYMTTGDNMDIPIECRNIFQENRSLFIDMSFFYMESMRDMETDFGVLPYPKANEEQNSYHTRVCYYFPYVVPATNRDTDMTGYLLEILNYRSYHDVLPAYYDVCLKTKYSRDEESSEMLDLIFSSRVIDIGDSTLCNVIRDNFIFQMMQSNSRDLSSMVAKNEKNIQSNLSKLIQ